MQQLEQMMGYQPMQMQRTQERERTYTIVNLESLSASALYSGDKPIIKDWGMIVPLKINEIPIHDTYNIGKDGDVSNGHSTVNLPNNGKVYMPHSIRAPSIKSGS